MADKNIQMTQRNAANTEWDNLYPKTKIENLINADKLMGNNTGFNYTAVNGGDANDYTFECHLFVFNMANIPGNHYGYLDVKKYDGSGFSPTNGSPVIFQTFTSYNDTVIRTRTKRGTDAWTNWTAIPLNDGTLQTGLNAEKVGGKVLIEMMAYKGTASGDLDNYKETGVYSLTGANFLNLPTGLTSPVAEHSILVVTASNGKWKQELITTNNAAYDTYANKLYTRVLSFSSWTPWKKILNQDDYDTLFQYANNGKQLAPIIGGPISTASTWEQIKSELNAGKSELATQLTNKGVSSNTSESMWGLSNKISQISTGKKFASGSGTPVSDSSFGYGTSYSVSITGLSFKPSTVVIIQNSSTTYTIATFKDGYCFIGDGSVRITAVVSGNDVKMPVQNSYSYTWYAYE